MTRLLAAFAFLTRIPMRRTFDARDVGRSSVYFPVVGAAIGAAQFLFCAQSVFPPLLTAVLAVALSAWITRAIHLDGLADFADGLAGGRSAGRVLEIMKDPHVGAFGVVAVVLLLGIKVAAIEALGVSSVLVVAPSLARWASVPASRVLPSARREGLGLSFRDHVGWVELVGATVACAGLLLVASPRMILFSAGSVVLSTGGVLAIAWRRIGGVTGDVLGANTEIAEVAVLVSAVAIRS